MSSTIYLSRFLHETTAAPMIAKSALIGDATLPENLRATAAF